MFRLGANVFLEMIFRRVMVTIPSLKKNGGENDAVVKAKNMYAVAEIMNAALQFGAMEVSGPTGNKFLKIVAGQEAKGYVMARLVQLQPKLGYGVDNMPLGGLQDAQYNLTDIGSNDVGSNDHQPRG